MRWIYVSLLAFLLAAFGGDAALAATTITLSNDGVATILNDSTPSPVTLKGTVTSLDAGFYSYKVEITSGFSGGTVILDDLTIDFSDKTTHTSRGPILVEDGVTVTFLISGDNKLAAVYEMAGIELGGASAELTLDSASKPGSREGKLTVLGGAGSGSLGGSAGIGGGAGNPSGVVTIQGGTITAVGGAGNNSGSSGGGAGIGGAGAGGTVTIRGGFLTATGGNGGNGGTVGGGGAGIGGGGGGVGGGDVGGDGATVTISGGIVVAEKGNGVANPAKDIGAGGGQNPGTAKTTTITGGSVNATDVDNTRNDQGVTVAKSQQTYTNDGGKTISFTVNPSGGTSYTYTFTVPDNDTAYLWLPTGYAGTVPATSTLPAASADLAASAGNARVSLDITMTGTDAPGVASYDVYRKASSNPTFSKIGTLTVLQTTYIDSSVANGTVYQYYVIAAVDKSLVRGYFTSNVVSATPTAPAKSPDLGPTTPVTLSDILAALNTALKPHTATPLQSLPASVGTPITGGLSGDMTFTKSNAPKTSLSGHTNLLPSFTSSIKLGSSTTGDTLALKLTLDVSGLAGFEDWANLGTNARIALLNALNVVLAYEYADGTWSTLVGSGGVQSWSAAQAAGIVSFTSTGISFNYAVTDKAGSPSANGDVMVVPDGAQDNQIVDPVWLMRAKVVPTGISLNPSSLSVRKDESASVTVVFTPSDATERGIQWSVLPAERAAVTATGNTAVWTVEGLSEGMATLTATSTADGNVKAVLSLTVLPKAEDRKSSSSGGCNATGLGLLTLALSFCAASPLKRR